ncbi:hypothetical protein [Lebetimonas sp. JH292]|uniref:hypothetical protein n=1 Tax=Lebetimonas sp. JH292 TaxID=990068 RepID=UPI0004B8EC2D|nr:hypothetical protein [Lebetimonas sp. JH292]
MKELIPLTISLLITLTILNILKLSFLPGFILGSIIWSILHYNIKKFLKGKL